MDSERGYADAAPRGNASAPGLQRVTAPPRIEQVAGSLSETIKCLDDINQRLISLNMRLQGPEPEAQPDRPPGNYRGGSDSPKPCALDVLDIMAGRASELTRQVQYQLARLERL
jgi:hypothetical protein